MKFLDTDELIRLIKYAEAAEFNRQIPLEWAEENLDPEGRHLVLSVWPYHERGERLWIMMKTKDDVTPDQQPRAWLDVTTEDYARLEDAIKHLNQEVYARQSLKRIAELNEIET